MIAFVFGVVNRPIPTPWKIIAMTMSQIGVFASRNIKINSANIAIAIPIAANF